MRRRGPYVRLYRSALHSTLWADVDARGVYHTAALLAELHELLEPAPQLDVRTGVPTGWKVPAGWYGLAPVTAQALLHAAYLDRDAGLAALERLGAPEPDSRTAEHDGRRLVRVDGGYLVLAWDLDRDETAAERMRRYRERRRVTRNATVTDRHVTGDKDPDTDKDETTTTKEAPPAPAAARRSRPTWLTPFGEAWAARWGAESEPPYREMARSLSKALGALGGSHAELLARWERFLAAAERAEWARPARFVQGLGHWSADRPTPTHPKAPPGSVLDAAAARADARARDSRLLPFLGRPNDQPTIPPHLRKATPDTTPKKG